MYRHLFGIHLRSMIDSFSKSKVVEHGRRNIVSELGYGRSIATSIGDDILGHGEELTMGSIQNQIVHALFLGERGKASNLLLDFARENSLLTAHDFVDILKYCARSPDPLFAMETWSILEEKRIGLNNFLCLLMTRALCEGGYLAEAYNLINFLGEKHGSNPSLAVYNCFLEACSKMHDMILANKCLDLMESRVTGMNEDTYLHLLELAVGQQNLSAVHEIWNNYIKCYSPHILSLRKFIWSLSRLRDLRSAFVLLQYMVALFLRGNTITTDEWFGSSRLDIPIPSSYDVVLQSFHLKEIYVQSTLLKQHTKSGYTQSSTVFDIGNIEVECAERDGLKNIESVPVMKVLNSSFTHVMSACAQSKNSGLAKLLMMQLQSLGLQPSSFTYDGFVRAILLNRHICIKRRIDEGLEMLKVMQQRNLKPCNSTFSTLAVACCKVSNLDLAEALLDQLSNYRDPHPYIVFLRKCYTLDRLDHAVRMFAKMKKLKIQPVIETYELLFLLFGCVNAPYECGSKLSQIDAARRINAIEMDMARNGIQHNDVSVKHLLNALVMEGMIEELKLYMQNIEDILLRNNCYVGTSICNVVLHGLVDSGEYHLAIEIFRNMKSSGVSLDAATYTTMINCSSKIKCYRSASGVVSLMLRDGIYPQTFAYTALIKTLLIADKNDEALNLLAQGISEGIQPDVVLFNTFLRKARKAGRIDLMELIVEEMHRQRIKPDDVTCFNMFRIYWGHGLCETAMEALKVLCVRRICEEYGYFPIAREKFEDLIFAEDEEAESRICQFFMGPQEGLVAPLLILRWCAISGSPISWSPDETEWAKRLSTDYDQQKKIVW